NQKIEGFFDVCRAKGLTGRQGVIIPRSNIVHLNLREDVVEAVAAGQFHIYAVDHSDELVELLTGVPVGEPDAGGNFPPDTVGGRVQARLRELAARLRESARPPEAGPAEEKPQEKPAREGNGPEPGEPPGRPAPEGESGPERERGGPEGENGPERERGGPEGEDGPQREGGPEGEGDAEPDQDSGPEGEGRRKKRDGGADDEDGRQEGDGRPRD